MKRIVVLLIIVCCLFSACNTRFEESSIIELTQEEAYHYDRDNKFVSEDGKVFYVAKDGTNKNEAIYDQSGNKVYLSERNRGILLFELKKDKLYFMTYNQKYWFEIEYLVLDINTLESKKFCELPKGEYFIDPIIYGDYVYYQNHGYDYDKQTNTLIGFSLSENSNNSLTKLEFIDNHSGLMPDNKYKQITFTGKRSVSVLGIVNNRIYFAYDPDYEKNPQKVISPKEKVISSCALDGSDERIVIDSQLINNKIQSISWDTVRIDNNYLYAFIDIKAKGFRLYRVDINTGVAEKATLGFGASMGSLAIGRDSIFVGVLDDKTNQHVIYQLDKEDLTANIFCDKDMSLLGVSTDRLYVCKTSRKSNKWQEKIGCFKLDDLGFKWLGKN